MEKLKELFGETPLTYDEFTKAITEKGIKLADLSEGNYVDKIKYEKVVSKSDDLKKSYEDLASKATGDEQLKKQIEDLKKQLETETGEKNKFISTAKELARKDLIREAGIKGEWVDLALFRNKDIEDEDEFKANISAYAKEKANLWADAAAPTPNLQTTPAGKIDPVEEAFLKRNEQSGIKINK